MVMGTVKGRLGVEREPAMRVSTRRRALGSQPGKAVAWKMPTRAWTKSLGSVSELRSPLAMAGSTEATKAVWMSERVPSMRRLGRLRRCPSRE
jgi:hypothetical protein